MDVISIMDGALERLGSILSNADDDDSCISVPVPVRPRSTSGENKSELSILLSDMMLALFSKDSSLRTIFLLGKMRPGCGETAEEKKSFFFESFLLFFLLVKHRTDV